jgi:hypothetical protein
MVAGNSGFSYSGECDIGALSLTVLAVLYGFRGIKPVSERIYQLVPDDEYTAGAGS